MTADLPDHPSGFLNSHALPPSDRWREGNVVAERQPHVGVDTFAVRGPVSSSAAESVARHRATTLVDVATGELRGQHNEATGLLPSSGAHLRVFTDGSRSEGTAEVSAPRMLRGDNRQPATATEVRRVVVRLFDEVPWSCGPDELALRRLDIACDFRDVPSAQLLLEQLSRGGASRMTTQVFKNSSGGGAESVYRETTRWKSRAYDRESMYRAKAAKAGLGTADGQRYLELAEQEAGNIRVELQLGPQVLRDVGLSTVGDLSDERCQAVANDYFKKARFDRRVGGGRSRLRDADAWLLAVGRAKELGPVVGMTVIDAVGLTPPSRPTVRKYRQLADQIDLTIADVQDVGIEPMRLHFATGTCLRGDAA